jgi:Tfp pilus assembly protein PilN
MLTLLLIIAVVVVAAIVTYPVVQARMVAERRRRRIAQLRAHTFETERRVHQVAQAAQAEIVRLLTAHRGRPGGQS